MMRRFCALFLLLALSCATGLGCGSSSSNSEPMTPEQLAEHDKQVQAEEEAHFKQERANAAPQPVRGE